MHQCRVFSILRAPPPDQLVWKWTITGLSATIPASPLHLTGSTWTDAEGKMFHLAILKHCFHHTCFHSGFAAVHVIVFTVVRGKHVPHFKFSISTLHSCEFERSDVIAEDWWVEIGLCCGFILCLTAMWSLPDICHRIPHLLHLRVRKTWRGHLYCHSHAKW